MSDNFSIYRLAKLKALSDAIEENAPFMYRRMCRQISKNFSMDLAKVEKMPVMWLLQHYYEDDVDNIDFDTIPDIIDNTINPEGSKEHAERIRKADEEAVAENLRELAKKGYTIVDGKKVKIKKDEPEKKAKDNVVVKDYSDLDESDD